ncbi:MAG: hypothetical protein AB1725_01025 [Armatimonadota bacterium]
MAKIGLLCFWAAALSFAPVCAMAQAGLPADDSRLDARVTVSHPVATIETFLDDLSGRIGVRLKADSAVKEDLIILRVKDVPARELMERVSKHFDWSWRAEDGGYVLYQSKEQKEREEKAYKEQLPLGLKRSQEVMRARLPAIEQDFEQNKKRLQEARDRFRQVSTSSPEWRELYYEIDRLEPIATPAGLYATHLFLRITHEQYEQMRERGCLVFALTPTAAQWRVPAELRQLAREVALDLGPEITPSSSSFEVIVVFSHESDSIHSLDIPPVPSADIILLDSRGGVVATQRVFLRDARQGNIPHSEDSLRGRIIRSQAYDELVTTDSIGTLRRFVYEAFAYLARGSASLPMRPYGSLASIVTDALDLNLLADAYALSSPTREMLRIREADLLLGGLFRDSWRLEDGWIFARSNTWAVHRRHAVRVSRLRTVRDHFLASGGLTIETLAQYGREFSFINLLDPFLSLVLEETTSRPWAAAATKLFGSLSPAQLARLAAGEALPARSLNPQQAHWAWIAALQSERARGWAQPTGLASGERTARRWEISEYAPNGLPSTAGVYLDRSVIDAARYHLVWIDGSPNSPIVWHAPLPDFGDTVVRYETRGGRRVEATLCRIVRVTLTVDFGNGLVARAPVMWNQFDPSAAFVSPDQLPEQVKRAIEEARRRRGGGGGP